MKIELNQALLTGGAQMENDVLTLPAVGGQGVTIPGLSQAKERYLNVTMTVLDIPALSPKIQERFLLLMEPYLADARYDSEAFDENGVLRQDFAADVLRRAVQQTLLLEDASASYRITLELVYRDGQWWVLPERNLIDIVAGAMTQ